MMLKHQRPESQNYCNVWLGWRGRQEFELQEVVGIVNRAYPPGGQEAKETAT